MNVLIADDEEYARAELQEALERTLPDDKIDFYFAEDHDSALKVIKENHVDIAFLDNLDNRLLGNTFFQRF